MVELVPVKIKKRKRNEDGMPRVDNRGQPTVWPANWDSLDPGDGFDNPGQVVRKYGGWHTNQVENLGTGAPYGEAMCLVPRDLAERMIGFIDSAELLTLAEAEAFCDTKCFVGRTIVERDVAILQGLFAERELRRSLGIQGSGVDDEALRALDLDDPTPGVRRAAQPFSFAVLRRRLEANGDTLRDGR